MTDSVAEKIARLKPFQKGPDPRRHKYGASCKEKHEWSVKFNNLLAKKLPPDEAVDVLIREYKRGKSWAVLEVLRRLVGEPIKSIEITGNPDNRLIIEVVKTKDND